MIEIAPANLQKEGMKNDCLCNRYLTACIPRDYRAQYCIDSSCSSCEADDLHHYSIHPGKRLIREMCVYLLALKKTAANQLHNINMQLISGRQVTPSWTQVYVRFSCLYRMTKWNRKKSPFLSDLSIKKALNQS